MNCPGSAFPRGPSSPPKLPLRLDRKRPGPATAAHLGLAASRGSGADNCLLLPSLQLCGPEEPARLQGQPRACGHVDTRVPCT